MDTVICGDGPMGRAVADELAETGCIVRVLGRPRGATHTTSDLAGADVVHEFSTAAAVATNVEAALVAGVRRFVIGTTGWAGDRDRVERLLVGHAAAAVASPTFSPGAIVLLRVTAQLTRTLAAVGDYDPHIVEWHRAAKRDRPSGTALGLARGVIEAHPVKQRVADAADGPAQPDALEVISLRAGSSPGVHLVGFDAPGETLELRLTARDRRCYASGARLAGEWLVAAERKPGLHPFESVIDDLSTERNQA